MRGLAGSRVAKVRQLFGLCKAFEEKMWKWRWFLTDVGCLEMQNAASFLPYILVVYLVVALCLYKIDFIIRSNNKVGMIYRHQSVSPDIINGGETMLCLTYFQESYSITRLRPREFMAKCSFDL